MATTISRRYTETQASLKDAELGIFAVVLTFILVMTLGALDELMGTS